MICVVLFKTNYNAAYQYHLHGILRKPFRTGVFTDKTVNKGD